MSTLLDLLESIDSGWLPPLFAAIGLLLATYFGYSAWRIGLGSSDRIGAANMRSQSSNSLLSSVQELYESWTGRRDYLTVLRNGVERSGPLRGWFADEDKLCGQFKSQLDSIGGGIERFPQTEAQYLKIVGEIERRPKPWWVWALLGVMMIAEAYGFSVLLAGYLNDAGSSFQDSIFATALSALIAVTALAAAYWIGTQAYKQRYALQVWKESLGQIRLEVDGPNGGSVRRGESLELTSIDNAKDASQPQATRMANRSKYVASVASDTTGSAEKNNVRRFTVAFWAYSVCVVVFGVFVLVVRTSSINDNFARDLVRSQQISATETSANNAAGARGAKPAVVDEQNAASDGAVTQESLEKTKSTKIIVTFVYMFLFWIVQAVAVVFSERFGFASDKGEKAFEKIAKFYEKHGKGVLVEEFEARTEEALQRARADALALATLTLKHWQLGLQTEYRNGHSGLQEDHRHVIEDALNRASERTFEHWLALTSAPSVVAAHAPFNSATPPQQLTPSSSPKILTGAATIGVDHALEFYCRNPSGGEAVVLEVLSQLRARVADAELDPGSLMVRHAGQPGSFVSYREFVQSLRGVAT